MLDLLHCKILAMNVPYRSKMEFSKTKKITLFDLSALQFEILIY